MDRRKLLIGASAATAMVGSLALTAPGSAARPEQGRASEVVVKGRLNSLNNSGAVGRARVVVEGRRLDVRFHARRVARGLPHAVHIHHDAQARHECPTARDDRNRDFRVNVVDGLPAYGAIAKSLTVRGDTSPESALAVDRFSSAPRGRIHYQRDMRANRKVARAIRRGEAVVVLHGVDYNGNGEYDFRSAGRSELDRSLPAEATDPAACGRLHR